MVKKGELSSVIFIFMFLIGVVTAAPADDFSDQISRTTYYAESYESGNIDYSQLVVYLASTEEEINAVLKSKISVSDTDLTKILGTPKKTNFVLASDFVNDVQVDTPAATWENKIIYDGEKLQIKISLTPFLHDSGKILYDAKIDPIFKKSLSEADVEKRVATVTKLAKEYSLDSNLERANKLAEESVNLEKIFPTYYQQSHKECTELMGDIFGAENLKSQKEIVVKDYDLSSNSDYKPVLELSICENCQAATQEKWIGMDFKITVNSQTISYSDEELPEDLYTDLGINAVKSKFIELNSQLKQLLQSENYAQAYRIGKRMELLNDVYNTLAHEGDQNDILKNYVDRVAFYNGLLEGYNVEKTSVYEQTTFEKIVLRDLENSGEVCTNNVDDNADGFVDCKDNLCIGQVCGTKTVTSVVDGVETSKEINLYCTAGVCKEKEAKGEENVGPVCGNKICEEGESETCSGDCVTCKDYSAISCSGIVISKGKDANGCDLEPVCLSSQNSCTTNSDCSDTLCGKASCVSGKCIIPELSECNQAQCVDGEKRVQECSSKETIVTQLCSNGLWKNTGAICTTTTSAPQVKQEATNLEKKACTVKTDCGEGSVCSAGSCVKLATKTPTPTPTTPKTSPIAQGVSFTGNVIDITGEYITSESITGVVGEEYGQEVDKTTVPQRSYDGVKAFSPFTGIISNPEEVVDLANEQTPSVDGKRELSSGVKDEYALVGTCTTQNQDTTALVSFSGGGSKFGAIDSLQDEYRKSGIEWCDWELEKLLEKRQEIEKSFNADFARWFFEEYLPNNAEDWENKKDTILKIYSEITQNQEDIAAMMGCLNLKELSTYKTLNINYETEYGNLKYSEKVGEERPATTTKKVFIVNPSLETSVFPSKEFVKKDLMKAKDGSQFPGSVESKKERESNEGFTNLELRAFKKDTKLQSLLTDATSNLQDGYLDVQVEVVDKDTSEAVYNLYVRANKNEILMQPMPVEKVPPGLDAKITVDYNALYDVLYTSEENEKDATKYAPWEGSKFRPLDAISSVGTWIDTRLKLNKLTSSIDVYPSNSNVKDILEETFFLIAEN